jgi:hypothetical protein
VVVAMGGGTAGRREVWRGVVEKGVGGGVGAVQARGGKNRCASGSHDQCVSAD